MTKSKTPTNQPPPEPSPMRPAGEYDYSAKSGSGTVSDHRTPYMVTEHERRPKADLVTDQVTKLNDHQRRLIAACDTPKSLVELMTVVGMTHRSYFRTRYLKPLLDARIIRMTNPERPKAANQRYVLTEAGVELRALHFNAEQAAKATRGADHS